MGRVDIFRGDVGNFSLVGSRRQKTRRGRDGGGGGKTFGTCTRRRTELKDSHR